MFLRCIVLSLCFNVPIGLMKNKSKIARLLPFFVQRTYIGPVSESPTLKEAYERALCCRPSPGDEIVGYFSHDGYLKVHKKNCESLMRVEPDRLVPLRWEDILRSAPFRPGPEYDALDTVDFRVLAHHREYGIDYSLKTARVLNISKQEAFDRHRKLRAMKLLERVDATMVQYRKGIVDHKWIKHRNHTYYRLTDAGVALLDYHNARRDHDDSV